VVLIDEYDKPIVEHIDNIEKATKNREVMRDFFGVLKSYDPFLRIEYTLNYPNLEVKQAFMFFLCSSFTKNDLGDIQPAAEDLRDFLERSKLSDLTGL
jgi:hypothetical protein